MFYAEKLLKVEKFVFENIGILYTCEVVLYVLKYYIEATG